MFLEKIVKAFQGGAEDASKILAKVVTTLSDESPHFAGHSSLWKLEKSYDKVSGMATTTWTLDIKSLRQRFHGDMTQCDQLIERIKNGVKWLLRVRHPGIMRVVSPLQEQKSGDLVFVSERVSYGLAERIMELKKARNCDSWSVVDDDCIMDVAGSSNVIASNNNNNNKTNNNNGNISGTKTPPPPQQKQPEPILDPLFGPVNNQPFPTRAKPSNNNNNQMAIDEALFGPPVSAPNTNTTVNDNANKITATSSSNNNYYNNNNNSSSKEVSVDNLPHESNINMNALDEEEVLVLLRGVATALQFFHSSCQSAHLNIAPESIVVIRGEDNEMGIDDKKLPAHLQQGKNQKSNSSNNSSNNKLGKFKETWKICDFTFACAIAELDSLPGRHCDHFIKVGGVRALPGTSNNDSSSMFSSSTSNNNNNNNNQNQNVHSALVNRLLAPVLDFSAPEYVLQNKPCLQSDVFSFAFLSFAVLRAAAEIPSNSGNNNNNNNIFDSLPRNLNASNDIAMYQTQLAALQSSSSSSLSWESGQANWVSSIHSDKNRRPASLDVLLKAPDALAHAGALALEQAEQITLMDSAAKHNVFFQLHRSLPTLQNGTLLRRVFPVLASVTDAHSTELHRYIAPLAISSAAVAAIHLKIFAGRGAAGPAVADALATIVTIFRVLFQSADMDCAIVLLEEHAKIVPAVTTIDDFTRNESSFFTGPTPGWISTFQGQHRDLTRSYIDLVLKAVRCDNVSVATPGVMAASTLLSVLSCGNDVPKSQDSFNNRNPPQHELSDYARQAKREDVAFVESLVPIVTMHAFGMAACNVGEDVRNTASSTTARFVKSIVEDRARLLSSGALTNSYVPLPPQQQQQQQYNSSDASVFGSFFSGGSPFNSRTNPTHTNNPLSPLQVSIERRANVVRETVFPQLVKMQGPPLMSCSQIQQRNWVMLVSACGKLMRPQEVAGAVLGMLGSTMVDGRISEQVAGVVATELQSTVAHLIQTRNLKPTSMNDSTNNNK